MADEPTAEPSQAPRAVLWLLKGVRLLMLLGILAILVTGTALLAVGAVETVQLIAKLLSPQRPAKEALMLASIKLVDLVLLATVLHIVAVGLYELFIDDRIPVPPWLRIDSIDTLKDKLIGVIVVLLGVVFLEQVIVWDGSRDLLPFGVGIAAMVLALTFFLSIRPGKAK